MIDKSRIKSIKICKNHLIYKAQTITLRLFEDLMRKW